MSKPNGLIAMIESAKQLSGQARGNAVRDLPLGQVRVSQYQALSLAFRPVLPVCANGIKPHVVIGGRAGHLPFLDAAGSIATRCSPAAMPRIVQPERCICSAQSARPAGTGIEVASGASADRERRCAGIPRVDELFEARRP